MTANSSSIVQGLTKLKLISSKKPSPSHPAISLPTVNVTATEQHRPHEFTSASSHMDGHTHTHNNYKITIIIKIGKLAPQVKVVTDTPNTPSSTTWISMVEGELTPS